MTDAPATRSDWENDRIAAPTLIPAPTRMWTREEMNLTRREPLPESMGDK